MQLTTSLVTAALCAFALAAPAPDNAQPLALAPTYIITCIGDQCNNPPSPTPAPPKTTLKSSVKVSPTKTSTKPTQTGGEEVGPSSTRCPVPLYYKCGGWHDGKPWTGCTVCEKGAKCVVQNEWYYQCVADE